MRKLLKRAMVFLTVFGLLISTSIPAFAAEKTKILPSPTTVTLSNGNENNVAIPNDYIFGYRKVNVTTTYAWTSYARVSDNLATGPEGGSLTSNRGVSYSTQVLYGDVTRISVSIGKTVSSSIGYTLNVGGNQTVYMGYKAYMLTETGTREKYIIGSGIVVESNTYKVQIPQYGQYGLINY